MNGTEVNLQVTVTNSGKLTGKEVVQVYVSAPSGKLEKEYQKLAAFAKTPELKAGESVELSIAFDLKDLASYDEGASRWVLEAGDYVVRVGNSSRNLEEAFSYTLPEELVLETPRYENVVKETAEEKALLDALSPAEMAELLVGGDPRAMPANTHTVVGTAGKTTIKLVDKGIGSVAFSDGPAGIHFYMPHLKMTADGPRPAEIPPGMNYGPVAAGMSFMIPKDGEDYWTWATAWPCETLLAQTWNSDLVRKVGRGIGTELLEFGISLWLAPGMNIQRNPLCGRNFEYFSEDPLLSGLMAAAITQGVQTTEDGKDAGVGVTIKHFCCNNQEDNRQGVSSNVSERALREIYLKGFELAVKQARPWALMSSYNRLNGTYTPNHHHILTEILRCEWGFEGLVMTDWGSCDPGKGKPELCAPAGNDLVMPGSDADRAAIVAAIESGAITGEELRRAAGRVLRVILASEVYR
jgi:beta-glucosidase